MTQMKIREHLLEETAKTDMKEEVEKALSVLVGQPFWFARRVSNLELLDFGPRIPSTNRKGEPFEHGEYALHIQCDWRFIHDDEIVIASNDMYYPPDGSAHTPEDFEWDTEMGNLYDVQMNSFMEKQTDQPLIVSSIEAGRAGSVSIFFNDNYVLDIFPAHSTIGDNYVEHWRLLKVGAEHFVFTGTGIEL
jgi:hypothetical protein